MPYLHIYEVHYGRRLGGRVDSAWDSESARSVLESQCCKLADSVTSLGKMWNSMPTSAWRGDGHHQADTCLRHTIKIQWCPDP